MNTYEVNYNVHGKYPDRKTYVKLLPCPFCGSRNLEVWNTHTPSFCVNCFDCEGQAHGKYRPKSFPKALASAVDAWNRRAPRREDRA